MRILDAAVRAAVRLDPKWVGDDGVTAADEGKHYDDHLRSDATTRMLDARGVVR